MKQYIKQIDGKFVKKTLKEIIIKKDGKLSFNPSEEMVLEDGWKEYIAPVLTKDLILLKAINSKKREIKDYDESHAVNSFYINDIEIWLDKSTRAGLKLRFEAEKALGKTSTTLWYENMLFSLLLDDALQLLFAIEVYASACYDNTLKHLSNVSKLATLEALNNYNYKADYPEKLNFEL